MKKKFVGVSYESDDGAWRVDQDCEEFHLINHGQSEIITTLTLSQLCELSNLFSDILIDLGIKEQIQISNPGDSFVPQLTHTIDPRFHPDPGGFLSL